MKQSATKYLTKIINFKYNTKRKIKLLMFFLFCIKNKVLVKFLNALNVNIHKSFNCFIQNSILSRLLCNEHANLILYQIHIVIRSIVDANILGIYFELVEVCFLWNTSRWQIYSIIRHIRPSDCLSIWNRTGKMWISWQILKIES